MKPKYYYYYRRIDIGHFLRGLFIDYKLKVRKELVHRYGDKFFYLMDSGRTALSVLLKSQKYKEGSQVLIPVNVCPVVRDVIIDCGLKPVVVDIDDNLTICPDSIKEHIVPDTKAIVCVGTYGNVPNYEQILKIADQFNIDIIQDLAHTFTASYRGSYLTKTGIGGLFSLDVTKSINVFGGGILFSEKYIDIDLYVVKASFITDVLRLIKIILFKVLIPEVVYTNITYKLIDRIKSSYFNLPKYKKLSNGGIGIFYSLFAKVDEIESNRVNKTKRIVRKLGLKQSDIYQSCDKHRKSSNLLIPVKKSVFNKIENSLEYDFPSPLPLLKEEKDFRANEIYSDLMLINPDVYDI